jgi:hypothetical protein
MYVSVPVTMHIVFPFPVLRWLQFSQDPGLYLSHEPSLSVGALVMEHTQSSPEWMQNLHVLHFL